MSAKKATFYTVAMLFTMIVVATGMSASGAGSNDSVHEGYGISAPR